MALRGESIGTAYIKILADGSGMDESVREVWDDMATDPAWSAGDKSQEAYWEGYREQSDKNDNFKNTWDDKIQNLRGRMRDYGQINADEFEKEFAGHFREIFEKDMNIIGKDADKMGQIAGRKWREGFAKTGEPDFDPSQIFRDTIKEMGSFTRTTDGFWTRWKRGVSSSIDEEDKHRSSISGFGDVVEKVFGGGSRNNFINFFAKLVSGPFHLVGGIVDGITNSVKDMQKVFTEAGGGMSGFAAVASKAGGAIAGGWEAAAVLVAILGPITGLISGLAAAIIALGSSVSFALGAGLGVLVGLLPLLAGGVVAAVLAFKGLKDVQGGKRVLKDLKDSFKGISDELAKGALPGVRKFAGGLKDLMGTLKDSGALKAIGGALGDVAASFGDALRSPQMKGFL